MLFDVFVCVGIMAIMPVIGIILFMVGYVFHQRLTLPKEKRFKDNYNPGNAVIYFWLLTPFVLPWLGIFKSSHPWPWHLGCTLCGMVGFSLLMCLLLPQGRAHLKEHWWISIVWSAMVSTGILLIRLS